MKTKEGFNKIVNFMTPGAGVLCLGMDISENTMFLLFLYTLGNGQDKLSINFVVMMTKEGSTKIGHFIESVA